jgi:hypothetical protein
VKCLDGTDIDSRRDIACAIDMASRLRNGTGRVSVPIGEKRKCQRGNHVGQSNESGLTTIVPRPHEAADVPWLDVQPALLSSCARELRRDRGREHGGGSAMESSAQLTCGAGVECSAMRAGQRDESAKSEC